LNRRILITGGAGFIGCNTARLLLDAGCAVTALDNLSLGDPANLPAGAPLVRADVARAETWQDLAPVDGIVHLAGASSAPMFPDNLAGCFENNILGFVRLLEWARSAGVRRVVFASTSSIYGNVDPPLREEGPIDIPNFYAVSKYGMEQLGRMFRLQYGLEVVGLRFMSVYGPREDHKGRFANLVSQFIWEVEAGRKPTVYGDGAQTRDFTSVWDVARAIHCVLEHPGPMPADLFNVGTGRATAVADLIELLGEMTGRPVIAEHIENPVKKGYVRQQVADITRIRSLLGWEPRVTLREGVKEILELRGMLPRPPG
jgi:UDP-glucose 4-epimerase